MTVVRSESDLLPEFVIVLVNVSSGIVANISESYFHLSQ